MPWSSLFICRSLPKVPRTLSRFVAGWRWSCNGAGILTLNLTNQNPSFAIPRVPYSFVIRALSPWDITFMKWKTKRHSIRTVTRRNYWCCFIGPWVTRNCTIVWIPRAPWRDFIQWEQSGRNCCKFSVLWRRVRGVYLTFPALQFTNLLTDNLLWKCLFCLFPI